MPALVLVSSLFLPSSQGKEIAIKGRKVPSSSSVLNWVPGSFEYSTVQCSAGPYTIYRSPYFRLSWNRVKWVGWLDNPRSLPLIFLHPGMSGHLLQQLRWKGFVFKYRWKFFVKKRSTVCVLRTSNNIKSTLSGRLPLNISKHPQWCAHVSGGWWDVAGMWQARYEMSPITRCNNPLLRQEF